MSREYYKRILVVWSIVVLFMAYICASAVTLLPNSAQIQSIYFIVEPTDSVAASSSSMSLRGGAGYVMADGGVAFSVYFSKAQAEEVRESLLLEYPNSELRTYTKVGPLTNQEKILLTALEVLCGWVEALKRGITQTQAREGVEEVIAVLRYINNSEAVRLADALAECLEDVLTVRELRYCACSTAEALWNGNKSSIF